MAQNAHARMKRARSGRLGGRDARATRPARAPAGARATLDLGALGGRDEEGEEVKTSVGSRIRAFLFGGRRRRPGVGVVESEGEQRQGGGRAEAKVTAASSLGSLQSYAQTTVRDSGPLQACFRNSTSEVARVKRFTRPQGEKDRGEEEEEEGGRGRRSLAAAAAAVDSAGPAPAEGSLEAQLVFSDEIRKNGLLSCRPDAFEYPNFALGEYGAPETWNSDVFVLVHNAIRWEIMDLYTIIGSLQRRWLQLNMLDMYELAEYWEVFELFIAQQFELEDQIVFPYLLGQAASSDKLGSYYNSAKYQKEKLVGMLYDVGATIEMFNSSPAGDVFPSLYRQLVDFLPALLEYMQHQDTVLPVVFGTHCHPEDRIMLNRAVANFLIRAACGRDAIAILTRWIEDSMILQIWKDENLSARAKSSHAKWVKRLEASHTVLARRFQRRLRSGNPSAQLKEHVPGVGIPAQHGIPDRRDPPAAMPDRPRYQRPTSAPQFAPIVL